MNDYRIDANGLLQFGLDADGVVDAIGLMTNGFVWSCYSPFVNPSGPAISTSWTQVFGTSSTVWTGATGTIFGPC